MKVIGMDLDGVLYSWHESLYEYFRMYRGYEDTFLKFWTTFVPTIPKDDFDYYVEIDTLYSNINPSRTCKDVLETLSKKFEIFYVTSRPYLVRTTTESYLKRHKFPFQENLIFTKDKVNVARRLKMAYAVDDSPEQIEELSRVTNAILLARPWNFHVQMEYPTAYGLKDIINFMED